MDLAGKALLPGFLDAHSHYVSALSVANQAKVYAPPSGPGKDVPSIVAAIDKFRTDRSIAKGQVIQAYGYDENVMPDGRLLNRDDLDQAFPDNPVLVGHVSMHGAVMNSAALKQFGISAATKTPPGGVIVRKPGSDEPYGLIMETAYLPVFSNLPQPTKEQEIEFSRAAQMLYAESGVTTAHEGATHAADLAVMQRATRPAPTSSTSSRTRSSPTSTRSSSVDTARELGAVRQPPQDRRREDHHRRLAARQDGFLHHAVPHGRPWRRAGLAR